MSSKPFSQLGSIIRHHWVITTIIILGLLFLGYRWLMLPQVNSHPIKKVVMRGQFPFEKGWELRIGRSFYARNSLCNRTAKVFFFIPQAEVTREFGLPFTVPKWLGGNRYEVEYYQDHFLSGFCDWTEGFVSYYILQSGQIKQGGALLGFPNLYNKINYNCFMQTLPVNTSAKYESGLVCLDGSVNKSSNRAVYGSNSSLDPSLPYGEVNFFWKEQAP